MNSAGADTQASDTHADDEPRPGVIGPLWRAIAPWRRRTLAALALLVMAKLTAVAVPLLLKAIVDRFELETGTGVAATAASAPSAALAPVLPVFLLLAYALMRFAGTLFTELRDLVFARVTLGTVRHFAERAFGHLLRMGARFHTQRNTGSLLRDVERGTAGIGFLLGAGVFTIVPTLVEFGAVLVILSVGYGLSFTLIVGITFLSYAALTTRLTQQRALRQRRVNDLDSRASGHLVDTLLNHETVTAHGREAAEERRYGMVLKQWVDSSAANQRALSRLHIGQSAIIAAGVAAVMLLAGQETLQGRMTVGDLVLVNAYVIQICLPLNTLGFVFREARDALVNTEKLLALFAQSPDIQQRPDARELPAPSGDVAFEQVDFGYEPGRPILQGLDLRIAAGQTVAVVGGSGSGKSTLARLLMRLYDVDGGRITIDGQDVRKLQLSSLRHAIGVVPQDTVLFNDTIAYNITYGREGAGLPEAIEAAKAAQVHEFILSLPQQYDTVVGERGMKLSGGEKQRIAIARAFLKNPPIMIFDEATSALDTRAERAIQGELDRIAQGRTTLVIAHRLSTIVHADEIIVMDRGRIAERGRHEALLAEQGLYAQLWSLQRQQREIEQLETVRGREPVNLAALLASALDGLRPEIEARRAALYNDIDLGASSVSGHPSVLAQTVHELCRWAVRTTPPGGRIEITLKRHGLGTRLTVAAGRAGRVEDNASRTRGEEAPRTPLGEDRRAARSEGPGERPLLAPPDPLQLRAEIEREGGSFSTEPPTAAHGTRYVLELPLAALAVPGLPQAATAAAAGAAARLQAPVQEAPAAASATPASLSAPVTGPALPAGPVPSPALAGLRVVCIDDHADTLTSLALLLEAEAAQVHTFDTGRAALAWLRAHESQDWPDLLVCDITLRDEDGHAVIRQVRQLEAERALPLAQRLPAIALTGHAQPDDRLRALLAGFQLHLAKPVAAPELVAALRALAGPGPRVRAPGA